MHPQKRPGPDRSPEGLEARLRALPPPPVPAELEARLLAAIPAPRRRRPIWAGVVGVLAAACLLAALAWRGRDRHADPLAAARRWLPVMARRHNGANLEEVWSNGETFTIRGER